MRPNVPYLTVIREPYPSDVSEEQWERIGPLIPAERPRGRHRETDPREIVNAISYRWTTGCAWRMLPHDFPPWTTVYTHFRRWQQDSLLVRLREELLRPRLRRRRSHTAGNVGAEGMQSRHERAA
jgi:transposase